MSVRPKTTSVPDEAGHAKLPLPHNKDLIVVGKRSPIVEVPALLVVCCAGPQLYVSHCPFCSGAHCHSGCLAPICSLCANGRQASLFDWGPPEDCDPRKTIAVNQTWGGKKFCAQHEYRLTLADGPPCYAPGHKSKPCARAIAHYLETRGFGAAVESTVNIQPDSNWHCARCPPCLNRKKKCAASRLNSLRRKKLSDAKKA